jgi:hypothetical protein
MALVANLSYRTNINRSRAGCDAFMASHGLPQDDIPGNEATGVSAREPCRSKEMDGNRHKWHGFSQPVSGSSRHSKGGT